MKIPLIESSPFSNYSLVEGYDGSITGRPLLVRGVFGRKDSKNENGRLYPTKVWTGVLREGGEVQTRVHSRNFFGELDHPDDGRTLLQRTSHIVTELGFGQGTEVLGTAEVLPTPAGQTLKGLFEARVLVGISSRGEGDVEETAEAAIVKENFQLQAFDFVHNPSTQGAYPRPLMAEHVRNSNGETLMDLMEEYRELEESVLELASLKPSEVPPSIRPLVEKQANETMYRLSKIIESAGEHRPLFTGLLAEAQAARRGIVYPSKTTVDLGNASLTEDELAAGPSVGPGGPPGPLQNVGADAMSKEMARKMFAANKSAKAGPSGKVEAEPEKVSPDSIPLVPGASKQESKEKEEGKMAETQGVSTAFRNLVKEAEAEVDKIDKEKAEGDEDKFASETAGKVESRLLAKTRGFMEDGTGLAPKPYEKEDSKGMITLPEEGEEDFPPSVPKDDEAPPPAEDEWVAVKKDDTVEIPPPPAAADEGEPSDAEGKPLPPMEAKLSKAFRRIVHEAKIARYECKVTEIIASKAISKLSKRVRAAEARKTAPATFIEANGKKIPVAQAGAVIESLVAKFKGLKGSDKKVNESVDESVDSDGPFAHAKVKDVSKLNEDTFRETGRRASSGSKVSTLDHQAELGARVASRIGRY